MPERPTARWLRYVEEQTAQLQAGTLQEPEEAWALSDFPRPLITATDAALSDFERRLVQIDPESDAVVLAVVQQVVLALNAVNEDPASPTYDTDGREDLCGYIDEALTSAGVDLPALAARHGLQPWGITDRWRDW
ncbi:hypothetical protein [Micromonospora sp. AMSO12t]|uniref:hypothetical protein n=1 Tax=Micromonospora sp. AMSO12t TaxID=2650410 RepID=UPI001788BA44|nr:hypothetical protein [Micromonospora sp. AMSO12t]